MRAPASPFENPSYFDAIKKDLISTNSGNLIFVHSIARALMKDGVDVDFDKANKLWDEEDIKRINSEYDAFIIPLANAFRSSFKQQMVIMTENVKKLNIPCVIVGVGYQGDIEGAFDGDPALDKVVKGFVKAVLSKSGKIGLRGEVTAGYLEHLGFKAEKDFTVIGCPSMYLYGSALPKPKQVDISPEMRINLNCKAFLDQDTHDYFHYVCEQIPDHVYIVQNLYELKTIFCGMNVKLASPTRLKKHNNYPYDYSHRLYRENKMRGFVSAQAWLDYLKTRDLNFGTRIHGNICGVLSGLPTFIVASDARVLELAEYHNIQHIKNPELKGKDIFELLSGADFESVNKGHGERFLHYLAFMHENGFETIFDSAGTRSVFDEKISGIDFRGPLVTMPFADYETQYQAVLYWEHLYKKERRQKKVSPYEEKIEQLKQNPFLYKMIKKKLND